MRAVTVHSVPASPVVVEAPAPQPEAGELLVKVAASSVNGFDAATAAGYLQGMMEHRFPLVLGKDFADLVMPGGRLASTLGFGPEAAEGRELTVTSVMADANSATLERLAADVAAGRIRVPVTRSYALDEAPKAFADFGAGSLGKLAVTLS